MSHPRHIASSFLLLATTLVAQNHDAVPTPLVLPADGHTYHGDEHWLVTRAVDGLTGQPLANAEMLLIAESPHPLRGQFWFEKRIAADAEGFLRVRVDAKTPDLVKWSWLVIRAPGYGPFSDMGSPPGPITRLAPAVDAQVRVLDRLGQPVANALLGLCGGCGHSPDLVVGTSDNQGLTILRGADPFMNCNDIYVEHPQLRLAYMGLRWLPGEAPMDLVVDPAPAALGVVLDAAGKPIENAFVGTKEVHRGPWTKTDAQGAFRLCGTKAEDDFFVLVGKREVLFERPPSMPYRLQLPEPNGEPTQVVNLPHPEATNTCLVQVRVANAKDQDLPGAFVRWIGPAPARDEVETLFYEPQRDVELRPGRYDVITIADDHGSTPSTFVVPEAPTVDLVLHPRALPTVFVRALDLPADGTVQLLTANGNRDIREQVDAGIPIGVPEEPFWLQLAQNDATPRTFAFAPKDALARGTLRLPWYRPTRIEGQLVDGDGKPARAALALVPCGRGLRGLPEGEELKPHEANGAITMHTEHSGFAYLVVRPDASDGRLQVLPVILPPRGDDAVLDLGTLDIDAPSSVHLRDAAGAPLTEARVALVRTGLVDVRDDTPPTFPLDSEGGWHGPKPKAGDALVVLPVVKEEDAGDTTNEATKLAVIDLPVRFPVQGDGPWTFTLPGGAIDLDVRSEDDDGKFSYTVLLGAEAVEGLQGPTRLQRVPAGKLRVYIASDGRQSAIVDVDVPGNGSIAVRARLAKR